jgi:hypothetical protein
VRIDTDHVVGVIGLEGADATVSDRASLYSFLTLTSRRMLLFTADLPTTSGWAPFSGERSYQVRPILEGTNRGRHCPCGARKVFIATGADDRSGNRLLETSGY